MKHFTQENQEEISKGAPNTTQFCQFHTHILLTKADCVGLITLTAPSVSITQKNLPHSVNKQGC